MATPQLPKKYEGPLELMKWFVLAVTLGPMLCCAGCLGYGFLVARFQQPEGAPRHTPPAETRERP
jgi:nitrate reductase NapE component